MPRDSKWIRFTPSGFEAFFAEIGARVAVGKDPQQPQDNPRGMEIAKKIGLEILPPPRQDDMLIEFFRHTGNLPP